VRLPPIDGKRVPRFSGCGRSRIATTERSLSPTAEAAGSHCVENTELKLADRDDGYRYVVW
jgi:hypothetical protein